MTENTVRDLAFEIILHGRGGHGSRPSEACNPVDCFAALYGALKSSAGALGGSFEATQVDGGSKPNIIRDDLSFRGVFRGPDPEEFLRRLDGILDAVCAAFRCTGEVLCPAE